MPLGQSHREVHVARSRDAILAAIPGAAAECGTLLDLSDSLGTATIRTRYGLQAVKLRVSILPAEGGSTVRIESASDDVWGGGARKGTDKFLAALDRHL